MIKTSRNYYDELCLVQNILRDKYHYYLTNANSLDDETLMLAKIHEYRGLDNDFTTGPRNWVVA